MNLKFNLPVNKENKAIPILDFYRAKIYFQYSIHGAPSPNERPLFQNKLVCFGTSIRVLDLDGLKAKEVWDDAWKTKLSLSQSSAILPTTH